MDKIIIYHGSDHIIKNPKYGMGKVHNDYGLGFYCTEYIDLAKEWACSKDSGGFANKYELDCRGLKVLDLNSDEYCVVHWISVLLKNRIFTIDSELAIQAQKYILKNFAVNTEDVISLLPKNQNNQYTILLKKKGTCLRAKRIWETNRATLLPKIKFTF